MTNLVDASPTATEESDSPAAEREDCQLVRVLTFIFRGILLRDMNLPKFIKDDERLFRLLLGDLFPSLELPVPEYGTLQVPVVTVEPIAMQ